MGLIHEKYRGRKSCETAPLSIKLKHTDYICNFIACTVINAFVGLVILRAIAGNITSYSREIYGQLKSLL